MAKRVDSWQVVCSLPRWLLPQDTNSLRLWSCNFSLTQRRWKMMKMLSLISVYNPSTIYIYIHQYIPIYYIPFEIFEEGQEFKEPELSHASMPLTRFTLRDVAASVVILERKASSSFHFAAVRVEHVEPLSRRLLLALCLAQKWLWLVQDPKKLLFSRKNEKTAVSQFRKPTAMSMMWSPMSPLSRGVRWIKAPNAVAWKFGIRNAWSPLPDTDEPTMKR